MLFLIALRMIFPRADAIPGQEPLVVPLAVPLVAGPSSMANVIPLATQQPHLMGMILTTLAVELLLRGIEAYLSG